jgi:5-methylcytosine-specific restriction endonuclease McrA
VLLERCKPDRAVEICDVTFDADVSTPHRAYVLSQAELFCEMCGVAPGDIDDLTGEKAKFHIGHIIDKSLGGKDELSNLRALCSTCNQGAKNVTPVKPPAIWLLSQIRRAGQEEQRAVLDWLLKKFKE